MGLIQMQGGRDALVKAPTGSGKTLTYLAPLVHDLMSQQPRLSRGEGTHALVLVPTRELCLQVFDVLALLLRRYHWLVGLSMVSGCEISFAVQGRMCAGFSMKCCCCSSRADVRHHLAVNLLKPWVRLGIVWACPISSLVSHHTHTPICMTVRIQAFSDIVQASLGAVIRVQHCQAVHPVADSDAGASGTSNKSVAPAAMPC